MIIPLPPLHCSAMPSACCSWTNACRSCHLLSPLQTEKKGTDWFYAASVEVVVSVVRMTASRKQTAQPSSGMPGGAPGVHRAGAPWYELASNPTHSGFWLDYRHAINHAIWQEAACAHATAQYICCTMHGTVNMVRHALNTV